MKRWSCIAAACCLLWSAAPLDADTDSGSEWTSVGELFERLRAELPAIAESEAVRDDFDRLADRFDLPADAYEQYVRVRTAFEATRSGGLWGLRWRITRKPPRSDAIWRQWKRTGSLAADEPTATAECDELSALFAVVARNLGVKRVGLVWPMRGHTVAAWRTRTVDGDEARIVVPTSQVLISPEATIGTDELDPWRHPRMYRYRGRDISQRARLPESLVSFFVEQVREHGGKSHRQLQKERNARAHGWADG